jgi:HSP20 family protein
MREHREPLLDVFEEGDEVIVVAELLCVAEQDINVHASENKITISVDKPQKRYRRELDLPAEVDPKRIKTSYKNGVLEVRLKKQRPRGEAAPSQKTSLHER